jgi:hypothetical protein
MTGYQSKKLMAEMRFENEDPNMFYNLRHLKQFQERTNSDKTKWFCSWDKENIIIYDNKNNIICKLDDIVLAEYITSLHNMSIRMIKEVESKYE